MNGRQGFSPLGAFTIVACGIAVLATLFWKIRFFDSTQPGIPFQSTDLYKELIPTVDYGFRQLRSGRFPLWNPYQLCGIPFFAIGWTGLLYPPHWVRLVVEPLASIDVLLVLHLCWAGIGMLLLARHLGLHALGGATAAATFMLSGYFVETNVHPSVLEAMSWMPLVVLLLDRVALGHRRAWLGLILVLTFQLMIGMAEIFLHTLYLGGILFLSRLIGVARSDGMRSALARILIATTCIAVAVLLALPLFLPMFELAAQSVRAAGRLSFEQTTSYGKIVAPDFVQLALEGRGKVTVGVWPLVALPFALATARQRSVAIGSLLATALGVALVDGRFVYELYYRIPVIGALFRRPWKFLDLYVFGQALLAGLAVTHLTDVARSHARAWYRRADLLAACALGVAALFWLARTGSWNWQLVGMLVLIALFAVATPRPARMVLVAALCVLQAGSLFFETGDPYLRPVRRPQIFHAYDRLFDHLQQQMGDGRIYLSREFVFDPGLTPKQGQLRRLPVSTDYEPLTPRRYADFFARITPPTAPWPFAGEYTLTPESRWHLMDLTSTKYFVVKPGEPADAYMRTQPTRFRPLDWRGPVNAYERLTVLPRAFFVARSRVFPDGAALLAVLDDPAFDPRAEVLLEGPGAPEVRLSAGLPATGDASFTSSEPERVVIQARASTPGFLVLGDLHYPGWQAWVDGREVDILRANYLFRAVRLDAGSHEVRFEYHPSSFGIGIWVSALTAVAVAAVAIGTRARG